MDGALPQAVTVTPEERESIERVSICLFVAYVFFPYIIQEC